LLDPTVFFTPDEVARARAYHRPLYFALAADIALSTVVTALLAFSWLGDELFAATRGPWWAGTLLFTLFLLAVLEAVRLPLAFWRGFVRERRWGFSTQSVRDWALDQLKGFAVGVPLTATAMLGLLGSIHLFPTWWPVVAVLGAALLVLLLVFGAPLLLEPIFNRFRPLEDAELANALRGLAQRAGVPVRDVLVADASRRTRKHNAYVSGIGGTRRVVLFDTLLGEAARPELEVVVAHELGHRRHRDVAKGTLLAMASAALAVLGAALLVLLLVFVAPLLLEPIFNRFRRLEDAELAGALRRLAQRAGVPVRDVLVADASRRTRKHNAYVSGIGGTRRVVLFDTLLGEAARPELEVVVAHELGHRRHRDVAKGMLLAMGSAALAVLVAWPLDPTPRRIPLLLLVWGLLELAGLPHTAAVSRRLERRADRFALELTHDADAFEAAFRRLARANLADLDPPRLVYALMFTHPTPAERMAATTS
jgi:Zn-dependent protease with chaperone function